MNNYRNFATAALLGLGLTLGAVPSFATPIPGIDAPLASSNTQEGYGSGSKSNFGKVKMRKKGATTVVEK